MGLDSPTNITGYLGVPHCRFHGKYINSSIVNGVNIFTNMTVEHHHIVRGANGKQWSPRKFKSFQNIHHGCFTQLCHVVCRWMYMGDTHLCKLYVRLPENLGEPPSHISCFSPILTTLRRPKLRGGTPFSDTQRADRPTCSTSAMVIHRFYVATWSSQKWNGLMRLMTIPRGRVSQ